MGKVSITLIPKKNTMIFPKNEKQYLELLAMYNAAGWIPVDGKILPWDEFPKGDDKMICVDAGFHADGGKGTFGYHDIFSIEGPAVKIVLLESFYEIQNITLEMVDDVLHGAAEVRLEPMKNNAVHVGRLEQCLVLMKLYELGGWIPVLKKFPIDTRHYWEKYGEDTVVDAGLNKSFGKRYFWFHDKNRYELIREGEVLAFGFFCKLQRVSKEKLIEISGELGIDVESLDL